MEEGGEQRTLSGRRCSSSGRCCGRRQHGDEYVCPIFFFSSLPKLTPMLAIRSRSPRKGSTWILIQVQTMMSQKSGSQGHKPQAPRDGQVRNPSSISTSSYSSNEQHEGCEHFPSKGCTACVYLRSGEKTRFSQTKVGFFSFISFILRNLSIMANDVSCMIP